MVLSHKLEWELRWMRQRFRGKWGCSSRWNREDNKLEERSHYDDYVVTSNVREVLKGTDSRVVLVSKLTAPQSNWKCYRQWSTSEVLCANQDTYLFLQWRWLIFMATIPAKAVKHNNGYRSLQRTCPAMTTEAKHWVWILKNALARQWRQKLNNGQESLERICPVMTTEASGN